MEFVIITGLSGAGRSQAMKALEDKNYYCIDNLPSVLIPKFAELCEKTSYEINKVALVIDLRSRQFFDDFFKNIQYLKASGHQVKILFLEANTKELVKRFKKIRRFHPLGENLSLVEAIEQEKKILNRMKIESDIVLDTTGLTIGQFKEKLEESIALKKSEKDLSISVTSFGFKHGLPIDPDLVFDVRFIKNPYYIEGLRDLTGNDKKVQEFVLQWDESQRYLNKIIDMIEFLLPQFRKVGKYQLIVAIGCTGGHHRSVTFVNKIKEHFDQKLINVKISHRDIEK